MDVRLVASVSLTGIRNGLRNYHTIWRLRVLSNERLAVVSVTSAFPFGRRRAAPQQSTEAAQELIAGESHDYYGKALGQSALLQEAWRSER